MDFEEQAVSFHGQVALITGAGRGLGRAYAHELARRGCSVMVNDLGGAEDGTPSQADPATDVVAELRASGADVESSPLDTSRDAESIIAATIERFGRLDILINNAGISGGGPLTDIEFHDFERMLAVHVLSTFDMTKHAWPHLASTGGRIVNTSSTSAFGLPSTAHYVTAKAAIIGLTKATALEGTPVGITANAIMPTAYTRLTAQIEDPGFRDLLQAEFSAERVAPLVAFLCSTQVPCTGEVFAVGAGNVARVVLAVTSSVTSESPQAEDYLTQINELLATPTETLHELGVEIPGDTIAEVGRVLTAISHRFTALDTPP
ncbi:MAG: SDR family NAD(P)-dependent oxidoreductase, partial [Acidimicrobiia bacterium]